MLHLGQNLPNLPALMPTLTHDGRVIELTGNDIIGAHRSCAVVLHDLQVERRHARIFKDSGLWLIEDAGTAVGTFLNGERLTEAQPLVSGSMIRIGGQEMTFVVDHASALAKAVRPPTLPWMELAGRTFGGHRIEAIIGRGSIGVVYRATQPSLERTVAFKVFDPALTVGADVRFKTEIAKVAALKHPGLATLHQSGSEGGLLWCSVELVQGETVAALLQRDGVIAPAMALLIAEKVAEATAAAHTGGVIHGDLRPTTIFIAQDGRVRLTDVGQMSIFDRPEFDPAGAARLAWYTSPESFREGAIAPSADVYSLGCVLWHLLVGRVPFDGPTAGTVAEAHARKAVPALPTTVRLPRPLLTKVNDLLQGLMGKTPSWRPQTMGAVVETLRAIRAEVEATPVPEPKRGNGSGGRPRTRAQRSGGGWIFPVVLTVVVISGVSLIVYALWPRIAAQHLNQGAEPAAAETLAVKPAAAPKTKPLLHVSFDDPADLQVIEVLQGQPRLDGGALTAAAGEPAGVACPLAVGGTTWDITVKTTLGAGEGQAVVTLTANGSTQAFLRIEPATIFGGRSGVAGSIPRPAGPLTLRLHQQGDALVVEAHDQVVVRLAGIPSLAAGQLRFEVAGLPWTLDDITVMGSKP